MARKRRHQQIFDDAVRAQLGGQHEAAERLLRRLLRGRPRDHEAIHQLGLIRWQQGEVPEALDMLEESAAMAPTIARYQANLGNLYQVTGRPRAALAALQRSVALDPDVASVWSNLGVALRVDGQLTESAAALREATDRAPESAVAWQNLGSVLEQLGDLDGAADALQQAAAIAPADAETWTAIGKLAERRGEATAAEGMYRRALLCDRSHAPAWSNLGGLLRRAGRLAEAVTACERAIAADPSLPEAYTHFGLALREQGHPEPAAATWQRGLQAKPTPEALLNLGDVLSELGLAGQSVAALSDLIEAFPDFAPGWLARGRQLLADGDNRAALQAFEAALALEPDSPEARHFLAAAAGTPSDRAPLEYVRSLFDEYAGRFEQHLTGALDYQTPAAVAALLGEEPVGTIVDLGCGTGLMGPLVRDRCQRLVGLDLSPRMIAQARAKGSYDELIVGTIEESLGTVGDVDVAIAADVLIYFGDLSSVLAAARAASRVIFSVESHVGEGDWVLRATGRYAHSTAYVRRAAAAAGFAVEAVEPVTLRKEQGAWVDGALFSLSRVS